MFILYYNSTLRHTPMIFSEQQMLSALWNDYKRRYLEPITYRTIDRQRGNVTTSEGQSYTMLRAAWLGDKDVFDGAWLWTQEHLGRPTDALFAWLFGQRADGSWGILHEENGSVSASDANVDIALALIFAYARWQEDAYLDSARAILADIWEYEVVTIGGVPYLAANNVEKRLDKREVVVNPSYLAPYAYRIFAEVDPDRPWMRLVDGSYALIERSMQEPLGGVEPAGLPPDWIEIDRVTGALRVPRSQELTTNYGFDAIRTPWRLALDWQWFGEERARDTLGKMSMLEDAWKRDGRILSVYARDGSPLEAYETPAAYGTAIGYFLVREPRLAEEIYRAKLLPLYNPDVNAWRTPLSYYDDNWAWFGIALYTNQLPNLAAGATFPSARGAPRTLLSGI